MAAAAMVLVLATALFAGRITVNGGRGWDGVGYVAWARDFRLEVLDRGLTTYAAQRVLPSAIVAASGAYTVTTILSAFLVLDGLLIVAAAYLWGRISLVLAWPRPAGWAGFAAVFGSFAIARHALYYPDLTDTSAFALGMAMTWAFLANRPIALWLVGLFGAFTWPPLAPIALVLLVLPRAQLVGAPLRRPTAAGLAVVGVVLVIWRALDFLDQPMPVDVKWAALVPHALLPVTIAVLVAWLGLAGYVLARAIGLPRLQLGRTVLALAGGVAIYVLLFAWLACVANRGTGPSFLQFQCELLLEGLRAPGWDLVHHVAYFGPIVLLAIGAWSRVVRAAASWGAGALIATALLLGFAIGSETRQWIHLLPLLAALTIAATAAWWTPRRALGFAILCLGWSKLWLPLDGAYPLPELGPWATDRTFAMHLIAAVVTGGVLVALLKGRPVAALASASSSPTVR